MFDFVFKNYCSIADVPTSKSSEGVLWHALLQLQDFLDLDCARYSFRCYCGNAYSS